MRIIVEPRAMLIAAALAVAALPLASSAQPQNGTNMAHVDRAVSAVAEFEKSRALPSLQAAVDELEAATAPRAHGTDRDKTTRAWFGLFRALDHAKDAKFNANDVPEVNIVPPPVNGVTYPSGTDPRSIPDPAVRAKYEQLLADNRAKAQRFSLQYGLRALDERAANEFASYVRNAYAPTAADTTDLKRLLGASELTAARKSAVLQAATKRS